MVLPHHVLTFHIVDLASLSLQQLSSIKKQLDDELEHLTSSFQKLRAAQAKFQECRKSVQDGVTSSNTGKYLFTRQFAGCIGDIEIEKVILVPLTSSLYVPGKLADVENVIIDVGTGFYVEKVRTIGSKLIFHTDQND